MGALKAVNQTLCFLWQLKEIREQLCDSNVIRTVFTLADFFFKIIMCLDYKLEEF